MAVIHPKRYVVLKLKAGTIFCKQAGDRPRWRFLGPNVDLTVVQPTARTTAGRTTDGDVVFGLVAKAKQTTVKVDEGTIRASARGTGRLVPAGGQATVKRGHAPGPVRAFTPTPAQLQTLASLEQDVTTTAAADLHALFAARKEKYGAVVAESTAAANQVSKQLGGIKLLKLSADTFRADPYGAALRIKSFPTDVVVVAGTFAGMSSVVDELTDPDYQSLTGKQLLVVFVPVDDKGVQSPETTAVAVANDHANYVGGCPVTVTFTGEVTYQGAGTIFYTWVRSDGAIGPIYSAPASGGKPITISTTWQVGDPGFTYDGWEVLKILGPRVVASDASHFSLKCFFPIG